MRAFHGWRLWVYLYDIDLGLLLGGVSKYMLLHGLMMGRIGMKDVIL
jgi:hypothetical protein